MFRLIIAIILAITLSYSFMHIAGHWLDMHVYWDDELLSPLFAGLIIAGVAIFLVLAGFFITISIIGVLLFAGFAAMIGIFIAGVSVFWPVVLILLCLYFLCRDSKTKVMD